MKICTKCGRQVKDDAVFCSSCGSKFEAVSANTSVQFCSKCGNPLKPGAKFCSKCGNQIVTNMVQERQSQAGTANRQAPVNGNVGMQAPVNAAVNKQAPVNRPANMQTPVNGTANRQAPVNGPANMQTPANGTANMQAPVNGTANRQAPANGTANMQAPANEPVNMQSLVNGYEKVQTLANENGFNVMDTIGDFATEITGLPLGNVVNSQKVGVVKSILNSFKNPKTIIITVLTALVWIFIDMLERTDKINVVTNILSVLTYAEGGRKGDISQIVGGSFGKIFMASSLSVIASGGLKDTIQGLKSIFKVGKINFGGVLIGLGIGSAACFFFISGKGIYGVMIGVSGIIMSLRSIANENGIIASVVSKLTSKATSKARAGVTNKIGDNSIYRGIFSGITIGFTIGATLIALFTNVSWAAYLLSAIFVLLGISITALTRQTGGAA